jgi:putative hemolysin
MEIYALIVLIVLNGFFAMSEIALVSARRARLQSLVDKGDSAARVAAELGAEPTRFLSTVQIGITSIAMLSGIVGEATLAPPLAAKFEAWGATAQAAAYLATAVVVTIVTYFSIVVGELVPKRLGQIHAERVARLVARPIQVLALACRPFVWLLTMSTQLLLRLLGIDDSRGSQVTEEEIHTVLHEGSTAGVIEEEERRMVQNLFRLDDRSISTMMTPRADIASLDFDASPEEVIATMETEPHARYPIVRSDRQDVIGVVSARALLLALLRGEKLDLEKLAKPPVFVPESVTGRDILESYRQGRTDMAFVVDEYGSLRGLVTLHDILEAITGQFAGAPEDSPATRREDGSWLFDGQIPMTDLAQHLSIRWPADGAGEDFDTLGGLILWQLGRIPQATDSIRWHGWQFEVIDMDGRRIDKVLASRTRAAGTG